MKARGLRNPLWLAIVLGVFAGVILDTNANGAPSNLDTILMGVREVVCMMVFPITISLAARRNYFWWGFVPGMVAITVVVTADAFNRTMSYGPPLDEDSIRMYLGELALGVIMTSLAAFVSAGPVSLIRYLLARRQRPGDSLGEPVAVPAGNEGAWPPAPKETWGNHGEDESETTVV